MKIKEVLELQQPHFWVYFYLSLIFLPRQIQTCPHRVSYKELCLRDAWGRGGAQLIKHQTLDHDSGHGLSVV